MQKKINVELLFVLFLVFIVNQAKQLHNTITILISSIYLLSIPIVALGAKDDSMSFQTLVPCSGNASERFPFILADGEIEADSYQKLDNFLKKQNTSGYSKVCFNSRGGDLVGAIRLGKYIRSKGW